MGIIMYVIVLKGTYHFKTNKIMNLFNIKFIYSEISYLYSTIYCHSLLFII